MILARGVECDARKAIAPVCLVQISETRRAPAAPLLYTDDVKPDPALVQQPRSSQCGRYDHDEILDVYRCCLCSHFQRPHRVQGKACLAERY